MCVESCTSCHLRAGSHLLLLGRCKLFFFFKPFFKWTPCWAQVGLKLLTLRSRPEQRSRAGTYPAEPPRHPTIEPPTQASVFSPQGQSSLSKVQFRSGHPFFQLFWDVPLDLDSTSSSSVPAARACCVRFIYLSGVGLAIKILKLVTGDSKSVCVFFSASVIQNAMVFNRF